MPEIQELYEARQLFLHQLSDSLEARTTETLKSLPHIDRISFRVKATQSFLEKALGLRDEGGNRYERPLVEIEDQVAGRVIVFFMADLAPVKQSLLELFLPIELTTKRPRRDDEFGYQSEHLILMIPPWAKPKKWESIDDPPVTFEVQLRTIFMHAYAEPQHEISYKSVRELTPDVRRELAWIAASAWGADAAYARVRDLTIHRRDAGGTVGA
jgi:putative GTP pyrophosphokinase